MKRKSSLMLLRIYDLLLGISFIFVGLMMINKNGIFADYPKEFLEYLPFTSWFIPGLISILVFGVGNILACIFTLKHKDSPRKFSIIMSLVLLVCIAFQVISVGEWYLATSEFLVLCFIQIGLSTNTLWTA